MAARRMGIMAFLVCICLWLMPCGAQAASTADAKELISTEKSCTLTVSYLYKNTALSSLPVKLYRIADASADCQYTLTAPFSSTGLTLNGVGTNSEWKVIRSTLESHIIANRITEVAAAVTDRTGQISFDHLKPGLYLAVPETGIAGDLRCSFEAALVALPGLSTDGLWQYQVAVTAKGTPLPPIDADEEISYKILKLWKGDTNSKRPQKIEVEVFRNGKSHQTVTLSEENHWSYTWTTKDDGAAWTIAERNVPSGYTATMEKRDTTFVLTNTLTPDTPSPGETLIQTGSTINIMLCVILLFTFGTLLLLLGIIITKNTYETSQETYPS